MDEFKIIMKKRVNLLKLTIGIIFMINIVLCFVLGEGYIQDNENLDRSLGFVLGMLACLIILGSYGVIHYSKALKDEQKLRVIYIQENDERKKLIKEKMAKSTLITSIMIMILAISLFAYFKPFVSLVLIITFYTVIIIALGYKIYYSRKY